MFVLLRLIINAALLVTAWIIPGIHLGAAGPHANHAVERRQRRPPSARVRPGERP